VGKDPNGVGCDAAQLRKMGSKVQGIALLPFQGDPLVLVPQPGVKVSI